MQVAVGIDLANVWVFEPLSRFICHAIIVKAVDQFGE
jgi:hypothetical protein